MANPKVALLANQASVTSTLEHTADVLVRAGIPLAAIFSPQHGFSGHTQANMIEVESSQDTIRGIPIHSLYGDVRKPTAEMLKGIDQIIVDLQDVGARGYTYVWTLLNVMEACSEEGVSVRVLDRPNPINGVDIEGPILQKEFFSFVGLHEIPIRHGLTIGELARMMKSERNMDLDLFVEPMTEWKRKDFFDQLNLQWVMPSPNLPTLDSTLVYPGMELLEGTNLSEGRGTTRPFECFGAPWLESHTLCQKLNSLQLRGVHFRPIGFEPTFDKWKEELCFGAQIHILDRKVFQPVLTAVGILKVILEDHEDHFEFLSPPYEYETQKMPFDILAGSSELRTQLLSGVSLADIVQSWEEDLAEYKTRREPFLLYS